MYRTVLILLMVWVDRVGIIGFTGHQVCTGKAVMRKDAADVYRHGFLTLNQRQGQFLCEFSFSNTWICKFSIRYLRKKEKVILLIKLLII
jgi:hypothetical protein